MGTIRYMSPEQLLAHRAKVDFRTDLWSLGVSLYEAITLDLPFSADTEEGYISAVASKDPSGRVAAADILDKVRKNLLRLWSEN